jgi:cytochrome c biogenesis protein CcdA
LETRTTHTGLARWLYFIFLVVLVAIGLGVIFLGLANAVHNDSLAWVFWDGGLILIVVGIGGGILTGIIAFGLSLWRARAANASRQSMQDSNQ